LGEKLKPFRAGLLGVQQLYALLIVQLKSPGQETKSGVCLPLGSTEVLNKIISGMYVICFKGISIATE